MSREKAKQPTGPFDVHAFTQMRADAHVQRDGRHFMTIASADAARRLAAILNEAVALADDPVSIGSVSPEFARAKIGIAVATALGLRLDFSK